MNEPENHPTWPPGSVAPEIPREEMTEKELLLTLLERQDKTDRRLLEGDVEIGMCMNAIQTLCELAGAKRAADELGAYIAEKRARLTSPNGAHASADTPTNPGQG